MYIIEPMKLIPAFKDYLWGGDRLVKEWGKNTPLRPVAESWEVSCHPNGGSTVTTGRFAGRLLQNVLEEHPEMIGKGFRGEFPILIKLIDAKESLSVQVHPDNAYAEVVEHQQGKNEMWYVVDALPGSELMVGFTKVVSKEELRERIKNNTLLEVVNRIPVQAGDCFEIPAGMLHAIGAGVLVAEVQQNSNVTYRVYDYDRRGPDGQPRELHIDKAVDVIDSTLGTKNCGGHPRLQEDGYSRVVLTSWEWFSCQQLDIREKAVLLCGEESFQAILVLEGELTLHWGEFDCFIRKGESVYLPAGLGEYTLTGKGKLILTAMQ